MAENQGHRGKALMEKPSTQLTNSQRLRLPKNIERVTAYRGVSRVSNDGWEDKQKHSAKVTVSYVYRCRVCDEYFDSLSEAREHKHG